MTGTRFYGKVAIISGSSSGIGQAAAVLLAKEGAKVTITGRNQSGIEETKQLCFENGCSSDNILSLVGDLLVETFLDDLISKTIETFGKLDILINNAGSLVTDTNGKEGWEMPVEVMDNSYNVNFRSVMLLTQKAYPHLVKSKGDIVNVSTFLSSGPLGVMSMPYYAIQKAALDQMTRSMAHEYILKGVRVNAVNPGLVSTSFFSRHGVGEANARKMEDYIASRPDYIPLGRVITSHDVAETIAFLADRKASECIVGESILIDGGSRLCCNVDMSDYKEKMNA